jgi:hypothetical protein
MKFQDLPKADVIAVYNQFEDLPCVWQRTIDTETYELDSYPTSQQEQDEFTNWYIPKYRDMFLKRLQDGLDKQLKHPEKINNELEVLEAELKYIPPRHTSWSRLHGYEAQERSKPFQTDYVPRPFAGADYKGLAEGAAYYLFKKDLIKRIAEKNKINLGVLVGDNPIPHFKDKAMVIRALYKLGIIKSLKDNHKHLKDNKTALANLISGILGITNESGVETIRKHIENVEKPYGESRSLQSPEEMEELRYQLFKVGVV